MTDTTASLRRKINSAGDLQTVVRTMKVMAASSIGHYEQAVRALGDYDDTVKLGLAVCFRGSGSTAGITGETRPAEAGAIGAVVFGSDQRLVGQFNDVVAEKRQHPPATGLVDHDLARLDLRLVAVLDVVEYPPRSQVPRQPVVWRSWSEPRPP